MTDVDAAEVLSHIIHGSIDPSADDYQTEARAVIAAIQADSQTGAELRKAILGFGPAPALWDRLDKTAPVSAQMIEWQAPHTAELIVGDRARLMAKTTEDPAMAALWMQLAAEVDGWPTP